MTGGSLDDYDRVEREVGEWAEANFGADQPDYYPLVGAAEEIGEIAGLYTTTSKGRMTAMLALLDAVGNLAHSVLKQAQGIREDDPGVGKHAEAEAIAEIEQILHYIGTNGGAGVGLAELPGGSGVHEEVADGVGDTNVYLADYSYRNPVGATLGECVEIAWYDEVQDREWDADVDVGGEQA